MQIALVLLPLLVVLGSFGKVESTSDRVVCYYTNWSTYRQSSGKFTPSNIDSRLCTHILYSFAVVKEGKCTLFDDWIDVQQDYLGQVVKTKRDNPNVKVLLAVGGWNNGGKPFSDMALTSYSRKVFIDSAIAILIKHGFDGLDLDWEYPGSRGGRPEDKHNFSKLIKELQAEFASIAQRTRKEKMLVSAAVSPVAKTGDIAYDRETVCKELDFVNMMQYDFHGAWDSTTGLQAALFKHSSETNPDYSIDDTVKTWMKAGCEADKLVIGIPMYGRAWTLKSAQDVSVGAPTVSAAQKGRFTAEAGILAYYEICEKLNINRWKEVLLSREGQVIAHGEGEWTSYDNLNTIAMKTDYIKKNKLGGAMIWTLDFDDFKGEFCGQGKYPLLSAINEGLSRQVGAELTTRRQSSTTAVPQQTTTYNRRITAGVSMWTLPPAVNKCTIKCSRNGNFKQPCDPRKFINCHYGAAKELRCQRGLLFNEKRNRCDWPYHMTK